jgi:hypothetical protein
LLAGPVSTISVFSMKCNCRTGNGCLLMNGQGFASDPRASSRPEDFVPNRETSA